MIYFILPAYNEDKNIKLLLNDISNFYKKKKISFHIIVVNDGSSDETYKSIKLIKKKIFCKLVLINHKKNMGLGMTLKTGFNHALKISKPDDIIVTMDSDNSHTPKNSYLLIKKINEGYDVVIASRYNKLSKTHGLSHLRKILSFISSIIFKILFPIKNVNDYTCGFRGFRINKIKNTMLRKNFFSEKGFSVSADIILKLSKKKLSFAEVPLTLRYDLKKGESKMKIIRTIFQTLKLMILRRFFSFNYS
jgi:dolichol-phosphate mannosyltransferase